jgi:hypothetical protein
LLYRQNLETDGGQSPKVFCLLSQGLEEASKACQPLPEPLGLPARASMCLGRLPWRTGGAKIQQFAAPDERLAAWGISQLRLPGGISRRRPSVKPDGQLEFQSLTLASKSEKWACLSED